jgi:tetratricopeptide (TPR) repeat protein
VTTLLVPIALIGWIPLVIVLFALVPVRTATAVAVIGAWLFLPPFAIEISGLPDLSKVTAAAVGCMLGTLVFGFDRLLSFRPRWFDLPMFMWCLCGIGSSLANGLGLYDGLSDALAYTLLWGLPYLVGRIYFGTPEDLRYFSVAMVIGGLIYVPPCVLEMRISPQLLRILYGHSPFLAQRLGGYRPQVFFFTGLECGLWMAAAALAGWWLWYRGGLQRIGTTPFGSVLLPILTATAIFCRSTGAIALLAFIMIVLWVSDRFKTRLLLAVLLLSGPLYVGVRVTQLWNGRSAVDLSAALVGADRAQSLEWRFMCEDLLMKKALQKPIFGWGGWGRNLVFFGEDEPGSSSTPVDKRQNVPTDGLWIIILGAKGYVGLGLFYLCFALSVIRFLWQFPGRSLGDPRLAAAWLAVAFLNIYMIDCLLNGFVNIIYITLAGGLIGLEPSQLRARAAPRPGIGAAGGRGAASGIEMSGEGPHSGRLVRADRCRSLARSFKQEGRLEEADDAWRQALDLLGAVLAADPGSGELRRRWCDCANDLAWLRANHPDPARRDPISALALARRTADVCPDGAAYWNTLGVAHYRAGDAHAAVAALDRATALGGGTAFDFVFLAMAHARLGDLVGARQELDCAILQAGREFPGHPELAGFCVEARALLAGADTPAAAR